MRSIIVLLLLTSASPVLAAPKTAAGTRPTSSSDNMILVTQVPGVKEGNAYDVTLPKGVPGDLFDQVWLVVDGHREGFAAGGGFFPYWSQSRKARLYANINNDLDSGVKRILKAQGLPVKEDTNVYRLSYGVNSPMGMTDYKAVRFPHSEAMNSYTQFPFTARYKVGGRIPLFEVVAIDSAVVDKLFDRKDPSRHTLFDPKDPSHNTLLPQPNGMVHRITIEVQFVPARHGEPLAATTP